MDHSQHNSDESKHGGHGHDHHQMMIADFKRRFWISLVLTFPILFLSPMIQALFGIQWGFAGDRYILFALSSIIFFYGGYPFLKGLKDELSKRSPGMMTLIAVAITAAYIYSSAVVFGLEGKTFFWELATLIVVMLLGHWIEMKSILGASKALKNLAKLIPDDAHKVHGDHVMTVKVSELQEGDTILVKPGEKFPVDGIITEGKTEVNESMLTGESRPVKKGISEKVIGGSINGNGAVKVQVKAVGDTTYLSKVIGLVKEAQSQKSKTQRLADRAAFWLTVIALVCGFGTLTVWLLLGKDLSFSLERMVTVMVICCPHALGLAIPLVAAISTSVSANNGLLIRNRTAFENSRKISTILFDKTGTLTIGSHEVHQVHLLTDRYTEEEIIQFTASAESSSEHHIAKGLQKKLKDLNLEFLPSSDFEYKVGMGISAEVKSHNIQVGGQLLLKEIEVEIPVEEDHEDTVIYVVIDDELCASVSFSDKIRESSYKAIQILQSNGIKCHLLTGDNESTAAAVARELKMDEYQAEVLPAQKLEVVKKLQASGEFVAMTGDGVNDAPALAQADVGIAIGSGTDVASETADIILVNSDPKDITKLILFGKATYTKMVQNLVWATGYNVITIPLATGFIPGLLISPAIGAGLMSLSTVICAVNAQLLRREISIID